MTITPRPWAIALAAAGMRRAAQRAQEHPGPVPAPAPTQRADLDKLAEAAKRFRAGKRSLTEAEALGIAKTIINRHDAESVRLIHGAILDLLAEGYGVPPELLRKEGGM
jgi:hypothetical protein